MARTYGALSDAEIARVRNQMSKGAKAAKAGAALGGVGKLASKGAAKLGSAAKTAARGIKNVASKASKSIYPSMPGVAAVAGKAAAKGAAKVGGAVKSAVKSAAKGAVKAQSVKNATRLQNKPQLKKAEPYYDLRTKSTKWSKDARIGELPRKAKRK